MITQVVKSDEPCQRWYAVQTRSNFEKRVTEELQFHQVDVFLPIRAELRRWKDRRKRIEVPVFKGYVFARFADHPLVRTRIQRTVGVARIVGKRPDGDLECISDAEIHGIQQLISSDVDWTHCPFMSEGDRVRVVAGPLKDVQGIFLRHCAPSRLVLSVPLLSQSVAAEVDAEDVELLDSPVTARPHPRGARPLVAADRMTSLRGRI